MSKFKDTIMKAYLEDDTDTIIDLYKIYSLVTPDLEILYTDDNEDLEEIVRILTRVDLDYGGLEGKFTLVGYSYERTDFVRFFAYLESTSHIKAVYDLPTDFREWIYTGGWAQDAPVWYANLKVAYLHVEVIHSDDDLLSAMHYESAKTTFR
jgi:hypothetical protein